MKRQANFEILRVVAMAMIVAMHFMQKGGILTSLSYDTSAVNCVAWLIESFCIVAANCYVLIAGYFLVDTDWKCKKVFVLLGQISFYSLLIPIVCLILGIGDIRAWTVYDWIVAVLPLQMDHYWFATAYVLMFLLAPVLATGVKQLSKKQLEITIGLLLVYFCVFKSISPILLSADRYGYDYPWFICLFLIAAYIKLYGTSEGGLQLGSENGLQLGKSKQVGSGKLLQLGKVKLFGSAKSSMICYVVTAAIIFLFSFLLGQVNARIGKFDYYMNMVYSYNHILTLFASLSLFFAFKHWRPKECGLVRFLCKLASYTFGVYLVHENIAIRNLWPYWLGVEKVKGSVLFVPYMMIVICVVFAVGMAVDWVRTRLFRKFVK